MTPKQYEGKEHVIDSQYLESQEPGYAMRYYQRAYTLCANTGVFSGCIDKSVFLRSEPEIVKILQQRDERFEYLINKLDDRLERIEKQLIKSPLSVRIIEIRELSPEKIKEEVFQYYQSHNNAYPDNVADDLNLDLKSVMAAVEELKKDGKIEEVDM